MKRSLLFILLLILSISIGYPQFSIRKKIMPSKPADSLDISYYSKQKGWKAAGLVVGLNLGVWGFNRYVADEEFAHINIHTIKHNLKSGFVWDNDQMGTNMFLHPYHGNLYFNAARANGYNYWESGSFAFGGSLMWELAMENELPSVNDIIATPIGGLAIGEVLYRTSDLILDDRRRGGNRFGRELASFVIAPTRGISRIISGDAWRVRSTTGKQFGIPNVSLDISSGVRVLELRDNFFDKGAGFTTEINVEYGDRYDSNEEKPYDYFTFRAHLNVHSSQPVLGQFNIIGRLWSTDVIDSKKDYLNFGIYQHFDYYDSDTISSVSQRIPYKFGTPASLGIGFIHKSKRFADWDFNSYIHLNTVLLGASLSDHYLVDKRNYNLGSGFSWKTGINIAYKDIAGLSWWYEGYRIYTWKGYPEGYDLNKALENDLDVQGDKSNAYLHTSSIKAHIKIKGHIYLTAIGTVYSRSTHYDLSEYENVRSTTGEGKLMLTYKF